MVTTNIIPAMIKNVPIATSTLIDSLLNIIAIAPAKSGDVEIITADFEAPIKRIEVKFINLPPGKFIVPAKRNHRKTPIGKVNISGV